MAERTRSFDWSQTPLGAVNQWPDALLVTVNTLLASPHPMFLWWGPDLVQFYNDAYRPSLGDDKHPMALGQKGEECWPEIWPIISPQIEQVMKNGIATWKEDQLIPIIRDGKLENVYWTYAYSPVRDLSGLILGTLVTCTETTRRQLAEQNLRQELQRMGELFQQAPAFFCVLRGPQHTFERINPLYQQLLGRRSLIGKSVRDAVPEVEEQGFIDVLNKVYETGEAFIGRRTPIKLARNGFATLEKRFLDFVYQPLREADGTVSGIIVLGVDVTDAKRAEDVLLESEKLAVVGRLASSIAHEINNPLEAVMNLIYLAKGRATNTDALAYLDTAEHELRRVSAITNQTLRFYRQATKPNAAFPENLVKGALTVFHHRLLNHRITLFSRQRAIQPLVCFEGEIGQVLLNLIGNAFDALKMGEGKLFVRSRNGRNQATGEEGVIFTVADTGSGMSADVSSRIFEPFFSTKGINGTGLGLWVTREIIERHRGSLRFRSSQREKSHGTVFTVFLPFAGAQGPVSSIR